MLNLLWFSHLVATAAVLAVGTRAGVDLATLRRCLLASPAASSFLKRDVLSVLSVLSVLRDGDCDESFTLALACKDLGLAVGLAGQVGVPVEPSAVVEQVYRRARAQYGGGGGEMLPVKLYEGLTRHLRLPPADSVLALVRVTAGRLRAVRASQRAAASGYRGHAARFAPLYTVMSPGRRLHVS